MKIYSLSCLALIVRDARAQEMKQQHRALTTVTTENVVSGYAETPAGGTLTLTPGTYTREMATGLNGGLFI